MSAGERERGSKIIAEKVVRASWFQRAANVACYISVASEVDTSPIFARAWQMKKRIFVPVTKKNRLMEFVELTADTDLRANDFGLYEPVAGEVINARALDVVLTPVVAFDADNHRVGMGGGYFDHTFAFLRQRSFYFRPKLVGLAFACQKVEKIVPNPWDIRLFCSITEN